MASASESGAADPGATAEVGLGPGDPVTGVAGTEPVGLCNWMSEKTLAAFGGSGTPATTGWGSTYHSKTTKLDLRSCRIDAGPQLVVVASRTTYGDKARLNDALRGNRPKGGYHSPDRSYDSNWKALPGLGDSAWETISQSTLSGAQQELAVQQGLTITRLVVISRTEKNTATGSAMTAQVDRLAALKSAMAEAFGPNPATWTANVSLPPATGGAADPVSGVDGSATSGYCQWLTPESVAGITGGPAPKAPGVIGVFAVANSTDLSRWCSVAIGDSTLSVTHRPHVAAKDERKRLSSGIGAPEQLVVKGVGDYARIWTSPYSATPSVYFDVLDGSTLTTITYNMARDKAVAKSELAGYAKTMQAAYANLTS